MTTGVTAQFWVRTDGNNANGGGYDSGIASAGTNYCDQATAQASWTGNGATTGLSLGSISGSTGVLTDLGLTGQFTSAMIGSCVQVSGQGYYWITAVTTANVVAVNIGTGSSSSIFTGVSGKLGGAFAHYLNLNNGGAVSAPTTPSPLVPGNQINVRATGSGSVGTPDYTQSTYAQFPSGSNGTGNITWTPYNGTPYIAVGGLWIYIANFHKFTGFYFYATGNENGGLGLFCGCANLFLINCTINGNNQGVAGVNGTVSGGAYLTAINCVFIGGGSSSGWGIVPNYTFLFNTQISGWGSGGIQSGYGLVIVACAVFSNYGVGIGLGGIGGVTEEVLGCTIDSNSGDGIYLAGGLQYCQWSIIANNNITNNGGYGINVSSGTAAANTAAFAFADYNNVYNNTSGQYNNFSGGAHDINVNPGYTGGGNYTPSNNALIATVPVSFA